MGVVVNVYKVDTKIAISLLKTSEQKVEVIAKISTNKLSTFDFFNFFFTTCFNPKQGPLQESLHFELIKQLKNN